jgi:hypothetical protein
LCIKKNKYYGGKEMSLSGTKLAGSNPAKGRVDKDFYATDPKDVRAFLERFHRDGEHLFGSIWECACGNGNIANTIKEYYPSSYIFGTDIVYRGYGKGGIDFLHSPYTADTIITNPPFNLLNDFITKGLEKSNDKLILFCKIQLLESVERKKILENSPLKYIYVCSKRANIFRNGQELYNGKKLSSTMCFAWFVWDKLYKGEPILRFI